MYEKRHLLIIAELLGVNQYVNTKSMNENVLKKVIVHNCKLDDSAIKKAIQNDTELDLNDTDKQSLIEDLITARKKQRGNTSLSNNYSTLMLVGQINSGLGWLMVVGCALGFLFGAADSNPIAAGAGLAFLPLSLLVVASGQAISCFVSTERHGKETTILLQKILDKMEAAG